MRVLTIVESLNVGGIETTLLSCIPYFKRAEVDILVMCHIGGTLDEQFQEQGVKLINDTSSSPISQAILLYKIIRKEKIDVVHSRAGHTSGFFAIVCRILSIPIIISVHSQDTDFKLSWKKSKLKNTIRVFYLWLHKILSKQLATRIIGHSKANLKYFGCYKKSSKYSVIYNGVNFAKLSKEHPLAQEKMQELENFTYDSQLTFIHIGSFRYQKNHLFLINLFAQLDPVKNNYKLILLGDGHLKEDIKNLAKKLNILQQIYLTGVVSYIRPYLEKSDIFIFPSIMEGFGNVLIEAQYLDKPIFCSNIPAFYEAAFVDYHRFFFSPTDVNDALAKFEEFRTEFNSNNMAIIKSKAKEFAKQFSISNMAQNIIDIYKDITK